MSVLILENSRIDLSSTDDKRVKLIVTQQTAEEGIVEAAALLDTDDVMELGVGVAKVFQEMGVELPQRENHVPEGSKITYEFLIKCTYKDKQYDGVAVGDLSHIVGLSPEDYISVILAAGHVGMGGQGSEERPAVHQL